jgi:hypothetical protein
LRLAEIEAAKIIDPKLTSVHFAEFNRQVETNDYPMFIYGSPIVKSDNNIALPKVEKDPTKCHEEEMGTRRWRFISNCVTAPPERNQDKSAWSKKFRELNLLRTKMKKQEQALAFGLRLK